MTIVVNAMESLKEKKDVEEFIDKLLTSHKFDKLTDKIAERAAEKILSRQHNPRTEDHINEEDVMLEKQIHSHEEDTLKEKEQSDEIKDSAENAKVKSTKLTDFVAKINTDAAIQQLANFPPEDLGLNYKHFTTRESIEKPNNTHKKTTQQASDENVTAMNDESVVEDDSIPYKRVDVTDELETAKKRTSIAKGDSKISAEKLRLNESDSDTAETTIAATLDESDVTVSTKKKFKKKTRSKKSEETTKAQTEQSQEIKSEVTKTEEVLSDDNKVSIADAEIEAPKEDKEEKKDYRHMIREENGKMYAFQQSPDYNEYHDKLTEVLQNVQEKNRRK